MSVEVQSFVDGEYIAGAKYSVHNPARINSVVGEAHAADAATVDRACRAAAAAAAGWAATPAGDRVRALEEALDRLDTMWSADELVVLLTGEQGKILAESGQEVGTGRFLLQIFSSLLEVALQDDVLTDGIGTRILSWAPVGPVAAVTPWNWPLALSLAKVFPAILAGNPIVLKPAPNTPLTVGRIVAAIAESLPRGVLNIVHGGADIGAALVAHPEIRKVVFTGSVPSGRKVYASAAGNVRNLTLELGGNDAALLLDPTAPDEATLRALLASAFVTSGQVCWAIKRLYVPSSCHDDVVESIADIMKGFVVGEGTGADVTMGPLNNEAQLGIVRRLVDDARGRGASVRELGSYTSDTDPDGGYFHLPTLVSGLDNASPLVQEEQFGPALPVLAYDDLDTAIAQINGTEYGLCGSVWSEDVDRAFALTSAIEAGQVFVNCHAGAALDYGNGVGGVRQSGLGREMGVPGLHAYLEAKFVSNRVFTFA